MKFAMVYPRRVNGQSVYSWEGDTNSPARLSRVYIQGDQHYPGEWIIFQNGLIIRLLHYDATRKSWVVGYVNHARKS